MLVMVNERCSVDASSVKSVREGSQGFVIITFYDDTCQTELGSVKEVTNAINRQLARM